MIDFTKLYSTRNDLCDAIKNEDVNKLNDILLKTEYINLNYIDNDGQTPLHRSCKIGNLDIVKILIKYGADLNLINRFGWYPIHIASYFGYTSIVLYLIEQSCCSSSSSKEEEEVSQKIQIFSTSAETTTPPSSPQSISEF